MNFSNIIDPIFIYNVKYMNVIDNDIEFITSRESCQTIHTGLPETFGA